MVDGSRVSVHDESQLLSNSQLGALWDTWTAQGKATQRLNGGLAPNLYLKRAVTRDDQPSALTLSKRSAAVFPFKSLSGKTLWNVHLFLRKSSDARFYEVSRRL